MNSGISTRALTASCIVVAFILLGTVSRASALCTISTTPVNFGSYNVLSPGPLDSVGNITVNCNETTPPTVTVSIGPSPNSGGFNPRKMKQSRGSELINYNLFINPARTQIWGDGSGATYTLKKKVFRRVPWISTVYGRIPPRQNVFAGNYKETLTVTIVW